MPVLLGSLVVLKTVVAMYGVPMGLLPSFPEGILPGEGRKFLEDVLLSNENALSDHVCNQVVDNASDKVGKLSENNGAEGSLALVQEGRVDELYNLIHKCEGGAGRMEEGWPQYTGLVKVSVDNAGVRGMSQWVLKEHVQEFKDKGEAALFKNKPKPTNTVP